MSRADGRPPAPIVDILEQTPPIPETCQWALFLATTTSSTLEMVTDEERDYMYRMSCAGASGAAQSRHPPPARALTQQRPQKHRAAQCAAVLVARHAGALLTAMKSASAKIFISATATACARPCNGVRTKKADSPAPTRRAFTLPIILDPGYHYEACNVEVQLANPHPLLWWMRRLLTLRQTLRALGEGKCEFLQPDNQQILSYILRHENEIILVVANLSRFAQPVELDLSAFKQMIPIELFGRMKFPAVRTHPIFLRSARTISTGFRSKPNPAGAGGKLKPELRSGCRPLPSPRRDWREIFMGKPRLKFEAVLPDT